MLILPISEYQILKVECFVYPISTQLMLDSECLMSRKCPDSHSDVGLYSILLLYLFVLHIADTSK